MAHTEPNQFQQHVTLHLMQFFEVAAIRFALRSVNDNTLSFFCLQACLFSTERPHRAVNLKSPCVTATSTKRRDRGLWFEMTELMRGFLSLREA